MNITHGLPLFLHGSFQNQWKNTWRTHSQQCWLAWGLRVQVLACEVEWASWWCPWSIGSGLGLWLGLWIGLQTQKCEINGFVIIQYKKGKKKKRFTYHSRTRALSSAQGAMFQNLTECPLWGRQGEAHFRSLGIQEQRRRKTRESLWEQLISVRTWNSPTVCAVSDKGRAVKHFKGRELCAAYSLATSLAPFPKEDVNELLAKKWRLIGSRPV